MEATEERSHMENARLHSERSERREEIVLCRPDLTFLRDLIFKVECPGRNAGHLPRRCSLWQSMMRAEPLSRFCSECFEERRQRRWEGTGGINHGKWWLKSRAAWTRAGYYDDQSKSN